MHCTATMATVAKELDDKKTLIVKHLPDLLSVQEKKQFFACFGATDLRVMPIHGRLKQTAFVSFPSLEKAKEAMLRLHQLEILDCTLSVEFAKKCQKHLTSVMGNKANDQDIKLLSSKKQQETKVDEPEEALKKCKFCRKLPPIAPHFGIEYPSNPGCRYQYPQPTSDILVNVCSALLTAPKFYTQVLHLMNKMNLYPPFAAATHIPQMLIDHVSRFAGIPHPVNNQEEDSESEYVSSDEMGTANFNILPPKRATKALKRKRSSLSTSPRRKLAKLKTIGDSIRPGRAHAELNVNTVFEKLSADDLKKPMSIVVPVALKTLEGDKIPQELENVSISQEDLQISDGFGKLVPMNKQTSADGKGDNNDHNLTFDFISQKQLEAGRLSAREKREYSLFKNYNPGQPSCRLYIKNLAKKATEKDLRFIFGHFVNFDDEDESKMFDIRVMTQGRMKGQAFVGMPSVKIAKRALETVNGYQLIGKPMVVLYARSAAPKADVPV